MSDDKERLTFHGVPLFFDEEVPSQPSAARLEEIRRLLASLERYLHPAGEGHRNWRALKRALFGPKGESR